MLAVSANPPKALLLPPVVLKLPALVPAKKLPVPKLWIRRVPFCVMTPTVLELVVGILKFAAVAVADDTMPVSPEPSPTKAVAVTVPVKVGAVREALSARLPFSLLKAVSTESVAEMVPVVLEKPVSALPVTVAAEMAVAP